MTKPAVRAWVQDFTYLWLGNCFYYLAVVLDLTTRQLVGWKLGGNHTADLICEALLDALSRYDPPNLLHSDQGREYLSSKHAGLCRSFGIAMSASGRGRPWQNGYCERFFSTLKSELPSLKQLRNPGELYEQIALFIHYYNTKRIHTTLKTTPAHYATMLSNNIQS